jgi:hypothetical protein
MKFFYRYSFLPKIIVITCFNLTTKFGAILGIAITKVNKIKTIF